MSNYVRLVIPGGTFFFTLVTNLRDPIFLEKPAQRILRESFAKVLERHPAHTVAFVLLPDHLHCIWTFPPHDSDYSTRWRLIKERFTRTYLREQGIERHRNDSRIRQGERGVWQRRFWEHCVRDEEELRRLCDYIHYNPVKHGLAKCPHQWPHSTFNRFVKQGMYTEDWACCCIAGNIIPDYLHDNDPATGE